MEPSVERSPINRGRPELTLSGCQLRINQSTDRGSFHCSDISFPCPESCVCPDTTHTDQYSQRNCDTHCHSLIISESLIQYTSGPSFRVPAAIPTSESWPTPHLHRSRGATPGPPHTTTTTIAGATALSRAHNLLRNRGRRELISLYQSDC